MKRMGVAWLVAWCSQLAMVGILAQPMAVSLRCEHLKSPQGIDAKAPRFSWKVDSELPDTKQRAFRVAVGEDSLGMEAGRDYWWDTGLVVGNMPFARYRGPALKPFTRYYWRVWLWGDDQMTGSPSAVAAFETGMMESANWRGSWISDSQDIHERRVPYFRRGLHLEKEVVAARVYIAVAGLYELRLNGQQVGDQRLNPMFTRYDRRVLYVTHDVTHLLRQGDNAIGVLLGNGWYNHQPATEGWYFDAAPWRNRPTFCLDLRVTYADGTVETVVSDKSWKSAYGALVYSNIYTGDHIDARQEQHGWDCPGFDDSQWKEPVLRAAPAPHVAAQAMAPIRFVEKIRPEAMRKINDTLYLYDLGRNITGISTLCVRGAAGTLLRVKHAERLGPDGRVDMSNIDVYHRPTDDSDPLQEDRYTLAGTGQKEEFGTLFGYKGFQYVEVNADRPVQLTDSSLMAYYMHSDVEPIGEIRASNSTIEAIWKANNNAYLGNLFGYPTDCPQREKNGWTGDANIAIETGLYGYDGITVYEKWLADHRDEQQPNGVLPAIIPTSGWGYEWGNGPDWTSTIVNIPWFVYLFKGDTTILADNYGNMKRYVDYLTRISPNGITDWGLGDWVPVKSVADRVLTSTAYAYIATHRLAQIAGILGNGADALAYSGRADAIKQAFNERYLDAETAIYGSGLQTELSVPLHFGMVPDGLIARVAKRLAERVELDGAQLDVGILGAKAILNALSENGYADLAYTLAAREEYPSWGWWIKNGATTFYENWRIDAERDISMNHVMFGEIGAWLYKALGGIKPDPAAPGFRNTVLEPHFVAGLTHFQATHESPYGRIVSAWRRIGKTISYEVTVPPNATARIYTRAADQWASATAIRRMDGTILLEAGRHEFSITPSK